RLPEQTDELVVVGQAEGRPVRMGERRRRARVLTVRVEGEAVHDRPGSVELTVGGPHVRDEGGRRMSVPTGAGPIDPAWSDGAADDEDVLVSRFHRVIRAREQLDVGGRSDI